MYKEKNKQPEFEDFILPFGGKLRSDNRWVLLSKIIPWDAVEQLYRKHFAASGMGSPAKESRVALGSLIIKEKLSITDEETAEQIRENPYLQYFIGKEGYSDEAPFDPSMMVHFRKRLNFVDVNTLNERIIAEQNKENTTDKNSHANRNANESDATNKGKLLVDATCAPADIRYPTDLSLSNEAREKAEEIIDILFKPYVGQMKKPRTYRKKARKAFVETIKKKHRKASETRKAIGKQLRFLKRDLKIIADLGAKTGFLGLSKRKRKNLLVIREVYRQQEIMYRTKSHRIERRIVSISQPHVRPIVRGKARADVEFGAKISISLVNGYCYADRLSWEAYNESGDLKWQIEEYRKRFGVYPESVHADKIYRTRDNIEYCRTRDIRLSGPRLGRPVKHVDKKVAKQEARQMRKDEADRIPVEGKFGNVKRRGTLACVMAKLACTSESVIAVAFLVLNLDRILRFIFLSLDCFVDIARSFRQVMRYLLSQCRARLFIMLFADSF
jgi:transposase, IS5 family